MVLLWHWHIYTLHVISHLLPIRFWCQALGPSASPARVLTSQKPIFMFFFFKLFFHDSLEKDVGIYRNPHEQAIIWKMFDDFPVIFKLGSAIYAIFARLRYFQDFGRLCARWVGRVWHAAESRCSEDSAPEQRILSAAGSSACHWGAAVTEDDQEQHGATDNKETTKGQCTTMQNVSPVLVLGLMLRHLRRRVGIPS